MKRKHKKWLTAAVTVAAAAATAVAATPPGQRVDPLAALLAALRALVAEK